MLHSIYKMRFSILIIVSIFLLALGMRLYRLTEIPPALHGDELGTGYNAYLILHSGKDENGRFLPFSFRNDFSPFIFYATVPFVALFGLIECSVRLPAVIAGMLIIWLMYHLVFILYRNKKLALLCTSLLAFSSWHIRLSRLGLEMIWALLFQLAGVLLLYKFLIISERRKQKFLIISFIFFGLSVITYQSAKLTTPLLIILVFWFFGRHAWQIYRKNLIILTMACIIIPITAYFMVRPFNQMRFVGISVFTLWKNAYPQGTNLFSAPPLIDLTGRIVSNYLVHFSPKLLFLDNTNLRYFQASSTGLLYPWQSISILFGLTFGLMKSKFSRATRLLLLWMLISPIPAALTTGVPFANAGRNLLMLPILEVFSGLGIYELFYWLRRRIAFPLFVVFLLFFLGIVGLELRLFLKDYFITTPARLASVWGAPLKTILPKVAGLENTVDKIIVTDQSQAYMYLLFYAQKEPKWLESQTKIRHPVVGYSKLGKYEFRKINWESDQFIPNALLIGTPSELPSNVRAFIEYRNEVTDELLMRVVKTSPNTL